VKDIQVTSELLIELVNYGTTILAKSATSKYLSTKEEEDVALLLLYRQILELTDGIEVLLSQSCTLATIPIMRSLFEAYLSIDYLLENEEDYTQRCLAWCVGRYHNLIDYCDRLDSDTDKGKDAKRLFDTDQILNFKPINFPSKENIQNKKKEYIAILAKPSLQPIDMEFLKKKKQGNKKGQIEWYSLFNGPSSIRALSDHLKHGAYYELLYRGWSSIAHGSDSLGIQITNDNRLALKRLRDPDQIREIANFSSYFFITATKLIMEKLLPDENITPWFKNNIMNLHRQIRGKI
jgi:hypothetical protein